MRRVKDIERDLAQAERQASLLGLSGRLQERRQAEVDELRAELAEAFATR